MIRLDLFYIEQLYRAEKKKKRRSFNYAHTTTNNFFHVFDKIALRVVADFQINIVINNYDRMI